MDLSWKCSSYVYEDVCIPSSTSTLPVPVIAPVTQIVNVI
jgi:hypothetical protein